MRKNSRQLEMDWPGVFLLMLAHGQQNKFFDPDTLRDIFPALDTTSLLDNISSKQ